MDLILEGNEVQWTFDEQRHLRAAEGYISLGMLDEADAELEQIAPRQLILRPVVLLEICVYSKSSSAAS